MFAKQPRSFSALQRAENSSIVLGGVEERMKITLFQCSSASRKFLNYHAKERLDVSIGLSFSALQRAENSSIHADCGLGFSDNRVSVLFSEPKIPQSCDICGVCGESDCFSALQRAENSSISWIENNVELPIKVSVLFSEPKIPQFHR